MGASLTGDTLRISTSRDAHCRVCLSHLLRSFIVNELLCGLNERGYYAVGYADDNGFLINGEVSNTVSELLQMSL